jgi:hypothetical protein
LDYFHVSLEVNSSEYIVYQKNYTKAASSRSFGSDRRGKEYFRDGLDDGILACFSWGWAFGVEI